MTKQYLSPKSVLKVTEFLKGKVKQTQQGDSPKCRYVDGWTEKRVAEACDVPVWTVTRVRSELYGSVWTMSDEGKAKKYPGKYPAPLPAAPAIDVDALIAIRRDVERIVDAQAMRLIEATEKQMRKHERVVSHVREMLQRIETHLAILHGRKIDESVMSDARLAQGQAQPALHPDTPANGKGPLI